MSPRRELTELDDIRFTRNRDAWGLRPANKDSGLDHLTLASVPQYGLPHAGSSRLRRSSRNDQIGHQRQDRGAVLIQGGNFQSDHALV